MHEDLGELSAAHGRCYVEGRVVVLGSSVYGFKRSGLVEGVARKVYKRACARGPIPLSTKRVHVFVDSNERNE